MYLIDGGKLLMQMMHKFHYELPDGCNNSLYDDVMKVIEDAPLIEADPVKHGRWMEECHQTLIPVEYDGSGKPILHNYTVYCCNQCGRTERKKETYCNCGAKMDLED